MYIVLREGAKEGHILWKCYRPHISWTSLKNTHQAQLIPDVEGLGLVTLPKLHSSHYSSIFYV